jgi:alanine dehydrogenase
MPHDTSMMKSGLPSLGGVKILTDAGNEVFMENGAGHDSGFTDRNT